MAAPLVQLHCVVGEAVVELLEEIYIYLSDS